VEIRALEVAGGEFGVVTDIAILQKK